MSRIAITEEDLYPDTDAPAVYGPVGGTTNPNVYGPVATPPPPTGVSSGGYAVGTWVLVSAAVAIAVAFGVVGFLAGRSGWVSRADQAAALREQRLQSARERQSEIDNAKAATRRAWQRRADERAHRAYQSGRAQGRAEARAELRGALPIDSTSLADDCLSTRPCP